MNVACLSMSFPGGILLSKYCSVTVVFVVGMVFFCINSGLATNTILRVNEPYFFLWQV